MNPDHLLRVVLRFFLSLIAFSTAGVSALSFFNGFGSLPSTITSSTINTYPTPSHQLSTIQDRNLEWSENTLPAKVLLQKAADALRELAVNRLSCHGMAVASLQHICATVLNGTMSSFNAQPILRMHGHALALRLVVCDRETVHLPIPTICKGLTHPTQQMVEGCLRACQADSALWTSYEHSRSRMDAVCAGEMLIINNAIHLNSSRQAAESYQEASKAFDSIITGAREYGVMLGQELERKRIWLGELTAQQGQYEEFMRAMSARMAAFQASADAANTTAFFADLAGAMEQQAKLTRDFSGRFGEMGEALRQTKEVLEDTFDVAQKVLVTNEVALARSISTGKVLVHTNLAAEDAKGKIDDLNHEVGTLGVRLGPYLGLLHRLLDTVAEAALWIRVAGSVACLCVVVRLARFWWLRREERALREERAAWEARVALGEREVRPGHLSYDPASPPHML